MRIIILIGLIWAHTALAELAEPPTPMFLSTVLVRGSGATVAAAQQQAREQAWSQTGASSWANTAITNTVVVSIVPTAQGYESDMWVTIKSIH